MNDGSKERTGRSMVRAGALFIMSGVNIGCGDLAIGSTPSQKLKCGCGRCSVDWL